MDFLMYLASLKGVPKREAQKRCKEMTELTGLDGLEKKKIKTYSGGMIRRLGITQALLENHMEEAHLTKGEKAYWKQKETGIEKPFAYGYTAGERKLIAVFYTMAMMQVIFVAVAVPSIFADEHFRKMDQLNLCCKYGKGSLFLSSYHWSGN